MLPAKSIWTTQKVDEEAVEAYATQTGLHPMVARLLLVRGIQVDEAIRFLEAGPEYWHDPLLMDGMKEAVERIQTAIESGEKIRIYGDYDADGVSSTAIMVRALKKLGAHFDYYIPHRMNEGYGLNKPAIDDAKNNEISLMITVDNGISAKTEIDYAHSLGIDIIVTDHHEPPEQLPELVVACVNPRRTDCAYPFKDLAGAGVAWKLAQALCENVDTEWTEIAAIGTIADLMPLRDENRALVRTGLKYMQSSQLPGLRALFEIAGLSGKPIDETHIGFAIGPRINAAGRLDDAELAVKLFVTDDPEEARALAEELDQLNKQRQSIVEKLTKAAKEQMEHLDPNDRVIVLAGEDWHVGVVGIVASRILGAAYRPVVVLSIDPESGTATGSARSIDGYDIHKALTACDDLLEHYGGHQAAGGMTLKVEHIDEFRQRLNELANDWLQPEDLKPKQQADAVFPLEDVSVELIDEIAKLAPFGIGNPAPRFVFNNLSLDQIRRLGKTGTHLKLTVRSAMDGQQDQPRVDALAFGAADLDRWMTPWANVNIFGELSINEWNGRKSPQIMVSELSIDEQQIFDWRGVKDGFAEWNNWLETGKLTGTSELKPLVLGNVTDEQLRHFGIHATTMSYEQLSETSDSSLPAEERTPVDLAEATELILYSLPPSLQTLKTVLRSVENVERVIVWMPEEQPYSGLLPSREQFKQLYVALKQKGELEWNREVMTRLCQQTKLTSDSIRFMLRVFHELEFIKVNRSKVSVHPAPGKRELDSSVTYQKRMERQKLGQFFLQSSGKQLADWLGRQLAKQQSESKREAVVI